MDDPRASVRVELIATIAHALKNVTRGDVGHAVELIHELATGHMDPDDVQREFDELELPYD